MPGSAIALSARVPGGIKYFLVQGCVNLKVKSEPKGSLFTDCFSLFQTRAFDSGSGNATCETAAALNLATFLESAAENHADCGSC